MKNEQLADIIIEKMGGKENILDAVNCMTRLRMHAANPEIIVQEDLKNTDGVLGLIVEDNYFQVVLGPGKAQKVAEIVAGKIAGAAPVQAADSGKSNLDGDWQANKQAVKGKQK